ncbi:MAG: hypothetical protein U0822_10965 [Anaerolineae bacterium]
MKLFTSRSRDAILLPLVLFICILTVYLNSPVRQTGSDSRLSIHTALAFLRQGNFNLDVYASIAATSYQAVKINGHWYPWYPLGTPLLAAPFIFPYAILNPNALTDVEQYYSTAEMIIASIITAATAVVIYAIARLSLSTPYSLLLTFIFAFCTSAWSTASRALWQHGPSMLCLSVALYLILLAQRRSWLIQFAAIPLAFSYVVRPTNSISVAALSVFVLLDYRRYFLRYILWLAAVLGVFVAISASTYGSPLPPYYTQRNVWSLTAIPEGLAGILLSPSRGLLMFSPVVLLAGLGAVLALRDPTRDRCDRRLHICVVTIIVGQVLLVSAFRDWPGGGSLGPRYLSDIIPYLMFLMIPAIPALFSLATGLRPSLLLASALIVVSFSIHARGALNVEVWDWNALPSSLSIDDAQLWESRLWDWYDPPFLRGIDSLDRLIPPKLAGLPTEIYMLKDPADVLDSKVTIPFQDERNREFYVRLITPPEFSVITDKDGKAQRMNLTILAPHDCLPGRHYLGDLQMEATRGEELFAQREIVSIPVICYVGPLEHVYAPLVPHDASP